MPIVISTFAAAQKVAATHGDTIASSDDARSTLARRAMVRWTHGLSAVEPGFVMDATSRDLSTSMTDREAYSPVTNYLLDRELPVPLDSRSAQQQMHSDFSDESSHLDKVSSDVESTCRDSAAVRNQATTVDNVLVSVAIDSVSPTTLAIDSVLPTPTPSVTVESASISSKPHVSALSTSALVITVDSMSPTQISSTPLLVVDNSLNNRSHNIVADDDSIVPVVDGECNTQQDDAESEPSNPSFADLLSIDDVDDDFLLELTRPLAACVTPIPTPVRVTPDVQVPPSPQSSPDKVIERFATSIPTSFESLRPAMVRVRKVGKEVEQPQNQKSENISGKGDADPADVQKRDNVHHRRQDDDERLDKENIKRSNDDRRCRTSPKQSRDVLSEFKIPHKPRTDNERRPDRPMVPQPSSRHLGDRRSDVRRPVFSENHRWYSSGRYDEHGLTRDQIRWLERMPRRR